MYDIGIKLKKLRKDRKMSQEKVAARLGLSKSSISGYENYSKIPSVEVLRELAIFYNVTTDYLLGIDKRDFINVDGLTSSQKGILEKLVAEFRSHKKQF